MIRIWRVSLGGNSILVCGGRLFPWVHELVEVFRRMVFKLFEVQMVLVADGDTVAYGV